MLGQAHTETGAPQSHRVDTGFRWHERHPKASRGRRCVTSTLNDPLALRAARHLTESVSD